MNYKKLAQELNPKKIVDSFIEPESTPESVLNTLLAEEYNAWYQYYHVIPFLVGQQRESIQEEFVKHADDELNDHANKLINRLADLGLNCILFAPEAWQSQAKCTFEFSPNNDVLTQCDINMRAEECAINHYKEAVLFFESDPVTQDMLKEILADEEEHYADLRDFIEDIKNPV